MISATTLLVFTFVIKIFSRKPLFTYIREQHGNETLRQCRGFEKDVLRYEKMCYDLRFLLACKKEKLVPVFAKPKLSIEVDNKIRKDIAALLIKTEIKNKHRLKNQLKKELVERRQAIQESTSFLLFHSLQYKIRSIVSVRRKKWHATHQRKLQRLREEVQETTQRRGSPVLPNIIHNFSSYVLTDKEIDVLSRSLDHYIPGQEYGKRTQVEFERFFQDILPYTTHLACDEKIVLKTKFLDTFNKYSRVRISNDEKKILENLYKNKDISVLRQDKGRGVVIMNKVDYSSKSTMFLSGEEFELLENDPTQSFQGRVQRTLLNMKKKFTPAQYKRLYPSSSRPGLYFGLAKVHKLKNETDGIAELPLRPVISNIGTATYEISKYLASLLQPIAKSKFTIESTKDFIGKIKCEKVNADSEMISFDVVSLFTSVPLDFTINLILKKVYDEKLITTKLKREELKALLELCTKEMHFSFNGKIYRQVNGVAMGSPLGPVLANIFMVELESSLVPTMREWISVWYRYVDDTFTFVRKGGIDFVLGQLNNFHESIKFTFEKEADGSISFLDVKVMRETDGSFKTDIHRKKTDTNIYLNWSSFAPRPWKVGTLKGLIRRAFTICSTEELRKKEVSFLKKVFTLINGYPSRVVNRIVHEVQSKMTTESRSPVKSPADPNVNSPVNPYVSSPVTDSVTGNNKEEVYNPFICLPYKGAKGEEIVKSFRNVLRRVLPNNVRPRIIYKGTKLGSCFRIKDKILEQHETNLVYKFPSSGVLNETTKYVGETKVRYGTRKYEHCHTDQASSIYKHKTAENINVTESDFQILDKGFSRTVDRKLAEALYIKELDPILNRQKKSFTLHLFN